MVIYIAVAMLESRVASCVHCVENVAFKCNNKIAQLLKPTNNTTPHTPYDRSGIYSLTCCTCQQAYVGQTSRNLELRYQEHTRSIRNNNPTSAYALHILQNRHEYGPMNTTMDLLKPLSTPSLLIPHELSFIVFPQRREAHFRTEPC
jgi:hypothetical protein